MINKFYKVGLTLFPLCRSITGKETYKTLKIIKKNFPKLKIKKIQSGKRVFDWKIPHEWNIIDAFVKDKNGKKIINFKKNNLHIVNYSTPISKYLNRNDLLKKIYSLPGQKMAIPYITSYYKKTWGFCLEDIKKKKILKKYNKKDKFFVKINSNFNRNGFLRYGELFLPGKNKKEILITTYICHPSMANNELSGPIVSMCLINYFMKKKINYGLRFIFIPETIGAITYINKNLKKLKKDCLGGLNLTCLGGKGNLSIIFSKYKNSIIDKSFKETLNKYKTKFKEYSFLDRGSDERQFNSPGIDIPVLMISRSKFSKFKEYHTSLDNFNFVKPEQLNKSYKIIRNSILDLQKKIIPKSKIACEPFLTKRKQYNTLSFKIFYKNNFSKKLLDFIQYSDGKNDLIEIQKIIRVNNKNLKKIFNYLLNQKMIY